MTGTASDRPFLPSRTVAEIKIASAGTTVVIAMSNLWNVVIVVASVGIRKSKSELKSGSVMATAMGCDVA